MIQPSTFVSLVSVPLTHYFIRKDPMKKKKNFQYVHINYKSQPTQFHAPMTNVGTALHNMQPAKKNRHRVQICLDLYTIKQTDRQIFRPATVCSPAKI
jgi:alpha-L-arabinofuranosidase